ncbi:MAG: hypothetical protein Q9190_004739 [Brigantiaea leucoxantha]
MASLARTATTASASATSAHNQPGSFDNPLPSPVLVAPPETDDGTPYTSTCTESLFLSPLPSPQLPASPPHLSAESSNLFLSSAESKCIETARKADPPSSQSRRHERLKIATRILLNRYHRPGGHVMSAKELLLEAPMKRRYKKRIWRKLYKYHGKNTERAEAKDLFEMLKFSSAKGEL